MITEINPGAVRQSESSRTNQVGPSAAENGVGLFADTMAAAAYPAGALVQQSNPNHPQAAVATQTAFTAISGTAAVAINSPASAPYLGISTPLATGGYAIPTGVPVVPGATPVGGNAQSLLNNNSDGSGINPLSVVQAMRDSSMQMMALQATTSVLPGDDTVLVGQAVHAADPIMFLNVSWGHSVAAAPSAPV